MYGDLVDTHVDPAPGPTPYELQVAKERRLILWAIAAASGLVGFSWGIRIIFALLVGQLP